MGESKVKALRWGVLGLGKIALKSMIPAFRFAELAELIAVGSRDLHKAKDATQQLTPQIKTFNYENLVHCAELDAIYIALPNHLHAEWAKRALKAGKHVLCEKPLAMNEGEVEDMNRVAVQEERLLGEAFMYRHHPQHQTVRKLIQSDRIGQVRLFRANFSYELHDLKNIRLREECGGGALMDVGCYGIDAARLVLCEEPTDAQLFQKMGEDCDVDVSTSIQLQFRSGIQAQIYCATDACREHRYEIIGTKGKIEVREAFVPAGGKASHVLLHNELGQKVIKHEGVNQYALELDHFARCVGAGEYLYPLENGRSNAKVLFRCQI